MTEETIRLHVTPFSRDLLSAILPSSASDLAKNVSYHSLQAFPENDYGFLDIPVMEAEKIKKKLNGSILKGKRIRIEEARPRKRALEDNTQDGKDKPVEEHDDVGVQAKKVKRDPTTIIGHELSPERKVKRGWTEPKRGKERKASKERRSGKGSSEQAASKYTDKEEVLFKVQLPRNKVKAGPEKMKKGRRSSRDVLVHEFEKSTIQPSFLRDASVSDTKRATEFVDGRGWVDEHGNVVDEEAAKPREAQNAARTTVPRSQVKRRVHKAPSLALSVSSSSRSDVDDADETSSSGISSDAESDLTVSSPEADASKPTSIKNSSPNDTSNVAIHPLEAIFKRPAKAAPDDIAKPSLEVQTSFNFFEPDADTTIIPDTPFNSQDMRSRVLRSAAPTPDTAAPSRFNSWGSGPKLSESSDESDDVETVRQAQDATPSKATSQYKQPQDSDFSKFFWESRGDNNRTWKRRKREANKEQRQRENRGRSRKF